MLPDVPATPVRIHQQRGPRFFWEVHRSFRSALMSAPAAHQPPIVHASDLYTLPAAHATAKRSGGFLTFDSRELYPHVSATTGRPWVSAFWRTLEKKFIPACDAVFTVSDSIADHIQRSYNVPRPTVVENVPPYRTVEDSGILRRILEIDDGTPLLLHQGQMRRDRGCTVLTRALVTVPDAHLVFLGNGPLKPELERLSHDLQVQKRVHFLDPVPPDQLLQYTASATIGATLLEDTCLNHRFALPNKLFEYLMAGIPVLASDLPEIRRIVTGFDVGQTTAPGDVQATASTLRNMLSDPNRVLSWRTNTSRVFETINWETASERFLDVFRRFSKQIS